MQQAGSPPFNLDDWIAKRSIGFSVDSDASFHHAVDRMIGTLNDGGSIQLLGLGEPLHGSETILLLRNRLFQRLVDAHGYRAIAIESSYPRGKVVDNYVGRRGEHSLEDVLQSGFSHGFGKSAANRALIEWMRSRGDLSFYGFDAPTEMMYADSPRQLLESAVTYLARIDPASADVWHQRFAPLLGDDAAWENQQAAMDPTQSIGGSDRANALRLSVEDFSTELRMRRPELAAKTCDEDYVQAAYDLSLARQLLTYHAAWARNSPNRISETLGQRDLMMADTVSFICERERPRGNVFLCAHNMHLQRGVARWQWGANLVQWWPAGAHLAASMRNRYAVIGMGVASSEPLGIPAAEPGTLESAMTRNPPHNSYALTRGAREIPGSIPTRSSSPTNPGYFPFNSTALTDFDALLTLAALR